MQVFACNPYTEHKKEDTTMCDTNKAKELKEKLMMDTKPGISKIGAEAIKAADEFCEGYKPYLDILTSCGLNAMDSCSLHLILFLKFSPILAL